MRCILQLLLGIVYVNPIDLTNIIAEASGSSNMLTEIQSSIDQCVLIFTCNSFIIHFSKRYSIVTFEDIELFTQ